MVIGSTMNCSKFLLLLYGIFLTITTLNCWLCIASSSSSFGGLCFESERQALVKFKQDLTDPSNRLSSWVGNDCCRWDGIVCDNLTHHVTKIKLGNPYSLSGEYFANEVYYQQQLGGTINPSLLDLKHLRHLDLNNNYFNKDPIPSLIGSIISLRYLNFSRSGFGGVIPHEIGNLTRIRHLDFSHNHDLSGDNFQWVSGLVSLRYLDMSWVNFNKESGWVHITSMLPCLLELHLSGCELKDISPSITSINFTSLLILDLSYNKFISAVPQWVLGLPRLVSLNIGGNSFLASPLPSALQNVTSLRAFLNARNDVSTAMIPKWLYNLKQLEVIDLSSNMLQGVLANDIRNLTSLINLDVSYNQLEGAIPLSLGKLRNLKEISLSYNNFDKLEMKNFLESFVLKILEVLKLDGTNVTGHLPNEIGDFTNLAYFSLTNTSISGPIPHSIGRLSNLNHLYLSFNQLNGTLPESLGQLSNLKDLDLSNNQLTGTLPESLGKLTMLESMYLTKNLLEGVVTDHNFANLKKLKYLHASGNKLTWKSGDLWIPPFQLKTLKLSNWQLGPKFPSWLQSQQELIKLEMSNTGILDSMPTKFWDRSHNFQNVNLSSNGIYGEIPCNDGSKFGNSREQIAVSFDNFTVSLPQLGLFSHVFTLDLSRNNLSGSIHRFLCNHTYIKNAHFINLGNNLLSGTIPDCWEHLQLLVVLKLDNNHLNGSIPSSVGYIDVLESLNLRNNHLSGELPQTLQYCKSLKTIDLGWNQFTGNIPTWVGKSFPRLVNLNLHFNGFHGEIPNELCNLQSIQILDLAHNNLSGYVPKCFDNFSAMINMKPNMNYGLHPHYHNYVGEVGGYENGALVTKGRKSVYHSTIKLVKLMDLSSNNLSGRIPEGLTRLVGLRFLNLSCNHFSGSIPINIGEMRSLESLDFSLNQLSGEIPLSLSKLTFLSYLNLSHNDLMGQIPSSTQLQSFDKSSFASNKLCGPPLENCNTNEIVPNVAHRDKEEANGDGYQDLWFIGSVALGFVVGFWAVICPLVLSRSWRITYFRALDTFWCKLSNFVFRCQ